MKSEAVFFFSPSLPCVCTPLPPPPSPTEDPARLPPSGCLYSVPKEPDPRAYRGRFPLPLPGCMATSPWSFPGATGLVLWAGGDLRSDAGRRGGRACHAQQTSVGTPVTDWSGDEQAAPPSVPEFTWYSVPLPTPWPQHCLPSSGTADSFPSSPETSPVSHQLRCSRSFHLSCGRPRSPMGYVCPRKPARLDSTSNS